MLGSVNLHDEAKLPSPVQADVHGLRANSESPVMPGVCNNVISLSLYSISIMWFPFFTVGVRVTEASISSTHFVSSFLDRSSTFEIKTWPHDSGVMLQHPEHPRSGDITGYPVPSVCRKGESGE